jgi:hypothetical protein
MFLCVTNLANLFLFTYDVTVQRESSYESIISIHGSETRLKADFLDCSPLLQKM